MYRTYDYVCQSCKRREVRLVEESERDTLQECKCGSLSMSRTFSKPHVRTEKLSMSFIDGQRAKSKEFVELRRQNELEDALFDAPDEVGRQEVQKEIDSLIGGN